MTTATHNAASLRRVSAWPSARVVTLCLAAALFVVFCVLPIIYMFGISLSDANGSLNSENYRRLLTEPRQRELLLTSTLLGLGAALLATALGAPLALAWILLTGPAGLLARALGHDLLSGWTYSLTGAVVVLGLGFYPLSMLATEAAARRVD